MHLMKRMSTIEKSGRDKGPYTYSEEAICALDKLYMTPEESASFYNELLERGRASIPQMEGHFYLRGRKVCYSRHRLRRR